MRYIISAILLLVLTGAGKAEEPKYQTHEFQTHSPSATIFKCALVGFRSGINTQAAVLASRVTASVNTTAEQSGRLVDDSIAWFNNEGNFDQAVFWREYCAEPFKRIAEIYPAN